MIVKDSDRKNLPKNLKPASERKFMALLNKFNPYSSERAKNVFNDLHSGIVQQ